MIASTLNPARALVLMFLLVFAPLAACDKHAQTKRDVQFSWEAYRAAAAGGEGLAAAGMLSRNTQDNYTRLLKVALDAPAAECSKLRPSDMFEVAGMRTSYTRKDLKILSGKGFVARAIKDGHWGVYDEEWKLRDIRISPDGDSATAVICNPKAESEYRTKKIVGSLSRYGRRLSRSLEAPPSYAAAFVREGDAWKYDETVTLADLDKELIEAAKQEHISVRDLVTMLATDAGSLKEGLKVWEPMKN